MADDGSKLSKEEIDVLLAAIETVERRRRVLLLGYLLAVLVLVGGQIAALVAYGLAPPGTFRGWVFLVPVAAVALVLWGFGRYARRLRVRPHGAPPREPRPPPAP